MISLLARIFIKNNKDYSNLKVREQYGVLCGGFGIFLNLLLFALKFIFGTIAASVAMVADAFNNLSDAASSIVQIFGFKLSSKKPDPDHPFGHGRIEYISGVIISFFILYMGIDLIKDSVKALINPDPVKADIFSLIVLVSAVLVKVYMYFYNHSVAKKINSVAMEATAKDSFGDVISTSVVILSVVLSRFVSFPVDGIGGIIVGIFILRTGFEAAKDTVGTLLGTAPSEELVKGIEKELLEHENIIGMHDLVVHDYGPGRLMISLHAEVPGDKNIFEIHDSIDIAEVDIATKFNCHVVIHMDPIDTKNKRLSALKKLIEKTVKEIDPEFTYHDVRIVPGITHSNLMFDVVKPFSCKIPDSELKLLIHNKIHEAEPDVYCVVTVDQPFVKRT
ncbi:MAG: cation transporter [Treponema sp.]|nr:cation transporter [Treponema sp.]